MKNQFTKTFVPALRILIAVLAGAMVLNLGSTPMAHASVFTVNSFADAVDANPGDGVCLTASGVCTLRAAIQEANALPGPDVISLKAGTYKLTIPGAYEYASATGDLNITDSVSINGVGSDDDESQTIIDGNGAVTGDRVIYITSGTVTLAHLTIQNGLLPADATHIDPTGGGLRNDGATVTLDSVVVKKNHANFSGGIYTQGGTLLLRNSRVTNNTATCGNAGGIGQQGGTMTLMNSTVDGNSATDPAGCVDAGNGGGAGINNNNGTVTLVNSTISHNVASGLTGGGGIRNRSTAGQFATLNVTNSTISGNIANGVPNDGGGIQNRAITVGNSILNLSNATIANNSVVNGNGGGIANSGGTVNLKNTILAGNNDSGGEAPDCSGRPLTSQGYNLLGNNSNCSGLTNGVNGDLVGTNVSPINARLSPLAMHGGNTRTHALLPKSPALDAGNACEPKDQRGVTRPQGPGCDIGSYERKVGGGESDE